MKIDIGININIPPVVNALKIAYEAYQRIQEVRSLIEEAKKREDLRKGSIDVEFKVLK